jgi:NhaA family Na+:H+ antiporter
VRAFGAGSGPLSGSRLGLSLFEASRTFVAERFLRPAQEFVQTEAAGGLVLLSATLAALLWANSPWNDSYFDLWHAHLAFDVAVVSVNDTLGHLMNDGLMTIFFFVVGLEIKRELLHGELASPRKAALPVAAALGGMIVPALIFAAWNGFAIPMASDLAFALGALALLGRRVPFALKVFVLGLAIVDDLGAISVIAVFYSEGLAWIPVLYALGLAAVMVLAARAGVRSVNVYVVLGILFWLAVYKSGVEATLAGVALAMLTPSRPQYSPKEFEVSAMDLLVDYRHTRNDNDADAAQAVLGQFEELTRGTEAPLERLERTLHPWVSYGVVPVFALANAGVDLSGGILGDATGSRVAGGLAMGLILGKPLGILLFSWLAIRLGIAELPDNVRFVHILGAGILCGIGFTVTLFVTSLAFSNEALVAEGKVAILSAALVAGVAGYVYLWIAPGSPDAEPGSREQGPHVSVPGA